MFGFTNILYEITWFLSLAPLLIYSSIGGKVESLTSIMNLLLCDIQVVFPPNSTAYIPFSSKLFFFLLFKKCLYLLSIFRFLLESSYKIMFGMK